MSVDYQCSAPMSVINCALASSYKGETFLLNSKYFDVNPNSFDNSE